MVNYRRVCEVLVAVLAVAAAAPCEHEHGAPDRIYDQRQNGTENYRLNIDGVVIAVAPADSLLSAVSDIDISDLFDIDSLSETQLRPKPPVTTEIHIGEFNTKPEKPADGKPEDKPEAMPLDKPEDKPEGKPQEAKPEAAPEKEEKIQKKSVMRKQEQAHRLKQRLATLFLPFLRKRRHQ